MSDTRKMSKREKTMRFNPGKFTRRCVYCGGSGCRTRVVGGWAHKHCLPKENPTSNLRRDSLKVWGLYIHPHRCIVAAHTQKEAAALLGVSLHHFRGYASETGNQLERTTALGKPLTIFACKNGNYDGPYIERGSLPDYRR